MAQNKIAIKIINQSVHELPRYATTGSSGLDICANLQEPVSLEPLQRALVPTGLFVEIPFGFEIQIRPRSGLAYKRGVTCLNTPGTIDSDYRGEIKVLLVNLSEEIQVIEPGERIAQMVLAKVEQVEWLLTDDLEETKRQAGGFGHTGI